MQEQIRKRYPKTKMAVHRRRTMRKWAVWNRYEGFRARVAVDFRVLPRRYYWHKKKVPLTEANLIEAIRKIQSYDYQLMPGNIFMTR